jgi:esterase/lipase superfamily enzyme
MLSTTRNQYCYLLVFCILLAGCQPKVYLMPPPISLHPESKLFNLSVDKLKDANFLYTLYATNRLPYDKPNSSSTGYSIFPSNILRLGFVVHSVGKEGTTWDDLYAQSIKQKRDKDLLIKQIHAKEMTQYDQDDDIGATTYRGEGFFDQINKILAKSFDKDILVYVHGANSNFYRATAQGAQYFHFTGHNSVVLTFSWPSAENILKYKTDVAHAKQTIPAFTRLLELLARHTNARNINILAYSAGAQVVAPGLASLDNLYPTIPTDELKQRLRIGEVYFAAPDTDFKAFVQRYLDFKDIVGRTTINLNQNDSVLRLAAFQNGVSRLGRPDGTELTEQERKLMIAALETPNLDVLDVGGSEALRVGRAHDSWYSHPWVSNDLLLLLLFNATPEQRGLIKSYHKSGAKGYRFPENYVQKIIQIIEEHKDEIPQKHTTEQEALK